MSKIETILFVTISIAAFIPSASSASVYVPIDSTYKLTFDDEFNGNALDTTKWNGGWYADANGLDLPVNSDESCAYDVKNISFDGSSMIFSAVNNSVTTYQKTFSCTSASVDTLGKFSQAYGYVEARIWVNGSANGTIYNWPAFWLVGPNWPAGGELDVLEGLDGGKAEYHFHSPSGGPGGVAAGNYVGWHVFAALWVPGAVTYYYDGVQVGQITTGITSGAQSIIITQAMGGIGGPLTIPSQMKIDYVHMYSNSSSAVAIQAQAGYGGPGDTGSSVSLPLPAPISSTNLLINPGFEGGLAGFTKVGAASLVSSPVHSGKSAVHFTGQSAGVQQIVSGLKPNTKYVLTGYVLSKKGAPMIGVKGYGGAQLTQSSTASSYQQLSVTITTGASNTSATIFCYGQRANGYCDDLSLTRSP